MQCNAIRQTCHRRARGQPDLDDGKSELKLHIPTYKTNIRSTSAFQLDSAASPCCCSSCCKRATLPSFWAAAFITSVLHSCRGRPTLRTYLPTCGCVVEPTKTSARKGSPAGARATLPTRSSCRFNTSSDKAGILAAWYTRALEMRETKAAGIFSMRLRQRAQKPSRRRR